ncbi:hypothetical protein GJAV_G00184580 [Gymnothorax javanicus]|nr:hypothetical protein GJAV_G00184580 [Gymnothorax javanicus]
MATACGTHGTLNIDTARTSQKEHLRKSKDSRRRQAALLFLNNISLDGRPIYHLSNGTNNLADSRVQDVCAGDGAASLSSVGSCRTVAHVSPSVSGGIATPVPRIGVINVPPILVLPTDSAFNAVGSDNTFLERGRVGSFCSQGNLLSPSGHQTPFGARKSPTLLSVGSCNSVTSDSRQSRSRNSSGSSRPRPLKKVHFIKNMRQYDTRGSRIVLICAKRSLCAAFSVLPYGEGFYISEPKLETHSRHRRASAATALEMLPGLEDVELGAYGRTVSYARFLYPTNALVRQKPMDIALQMPLSRSSISRSYAPSRLNSAIGLDLGVDELSDYDPNLLSDPQWPCGKHKRVLIFSSYMTTVIEYVKPSDLKKDMNESFKEKFPHIKLTLSKIRSLKREMRVVSEDSDLQPVTVAMAFVYFEKLVLQGRLNKQNRKLVSAACVLLAAKISSDMKKQEVKALIDKLEERFRISRRELIPFEFTILVALEMALYLPESKVLPHYRQLVQQP